MADTAHPAQPGSLPRSLFVFALLYGGRWSCWPACSAPSSPRSAPGRCSAASRSIGHLRLSAAGRAGERDGGASRQGPGERTGALGLRAAHRLDDPVDDRPYTSCRRPPSGPTRRSSPAAGAGRAHAVRRPHLLRHLADAERRRLLPSRQRREQERRAALAARLDRRAALAGGRHGDLHHHFLLRGAADPAGDGRADHFQAAALHRHGAAADLSLRGARAEARQRTRPCHDQQSRARPGAARQGRSSHRGAALHAASCRQDLRGEIWRPCHGAIRKPRATSPRMSCS